MSYKVVIADDEPLVLIGLEDMIDWGKEGFEIIAQARNGGQLEKIINESQPDLVISDIKMPIKSGIEVLESLAKQDKRRPLFIFLTSFEEFDLIKKAIKLEAVDYIVKLELDRPQLIEALKKAKEKIDRERGQMNTSSAISETKFLQGRWFLRQLFSIDTQDLSAEEVGLDLNYDAFSVAYISLNSLIDKGGASNLFFSAYRLIEETANRYTKCYLTELDYGHIAAIMPFKERQREGYRSYVNSAFSASIEALKSFFSISASVSCGPLVDNIKAISESFFKARNLASKGEKGIIFFDHRENREIESSSVHLDSEAFTKAFAELNADLLRESTEALIKDLSAPSTTKVYALDAASSVLYMACNLIPDAQNCLEEIFPNEENIFSYRQLYQALTPSDVISWLEKFSSGFCKIFSERRQDYRQQTIQKVQAYIRDNVDKRLSLGMVASVFGYSQNYLSSLFGKYAGMSFIDYVNTQKIEKAKVMLNNPNALVYEVATNLGFESPFYFSKVFKKVTGLSPTTWQNNIKAGGNQ